MVSQPILMPKLGLTMTEGTLVEWKVAPGDSVAAGDVIFVVETDKISNEIEAADAGTVIALHIAENETVAVGAAVATLAIDGVAPAEPAVAPPQAPSPPPVMTDKPAAAQAPASAPDEPVRHRATPLARRLAIQANLSLQDIAGSGPSGRITADDVTAAVSLASKVPAPAPALAPSVEPAQAPETGRPIPLSPFQRVTGRLMVQAKTEIPHFYVFAEADVTALLDLRGQLNADPAFPRVSVSHFILTAMARALVALPALNRVWADGALLEQPQVDVGLAIESPKGLIAPVLRDIGGCGVSEVAAVATRLVDLARAGRIEPGDLKGGATALSNVGMFGATGLVPIVLPGQSSILGVGASQGRFRPDAHGQPCLRQILNLTLSCDHRVVDGAIAARFLQIIQQGLEAPAALLRQRPKD